MVQGTATSARHCGKYCTQSHCQLLGICETEQSTSCQAQPGQSAGVREGNTVCGWLRSCLPARRTHLGVYRVWSARAGTHPAVSGSVNARRGPELVHQHHPAPAPAPMSIGHLLSWYWDANPRVSGMAVRKAQSQTRPGDNFGQSRGGGCSGCICLLCCGWLGSESCCGVLVQEQKQVLRHPPMGLLSMPLHRCPRMQLESASPVPHKTKQSLHSCLPCKPLLAWVFLQCRSQSFIVKKIK